MPFFISPLDSQLTVKHKLSFFFSFHLSLICPFAACCHAVSPLSPLFLLCVCCLSFDLSPPHFCYFLQGNMKKKKNPSAAPFHFVLFQSRRPILFSLADDFSACCCLKLMKTIFHLHGVIWLGVAAQVCYGKINIMEGLALLS